MSTANLWFFILISLSAFGVKKNDCEGAFDRSNPVFDELVRLRLLMDDSRETDFERRERIRGYRKRMQEVALEVDIDPRVLVAHVESAARSKFVISMNERPPRGSSDLEPRSTADLLADLEIERWTLSQVRFVEFDDPVWQMRAWRDPKGLIWSDVIRRKDGAVLRVKYLDAERICKELGGRLPTTEEYTSVRAALLKPCASEYVPQIFMEGTAGIELFWCDSPNSSASYFADYFIGATGTLDNDDRDITYNAFRCVRN